MPTEAPGPALGIILVSGEHARAHAAFLLAAGAAALGRAVTLFATGEGVRALCTEFPSLAAEDAALSARGVAGLDTLRDASLELGVALIACPSGLLSAGVAADALLPGVSCAGLSVFLEATRQAQLISL
jgi:peroxiredoxin family protein